MSCSLIQARSSGLLPPPARCPQMLGMTRSSDHIRPGLEADAVIQYRLAVGGRFEAVRDYSFDHPGASEGVEMGEAAV